MLNLTIQFSRMQKTAAFLFVVSVHFTVAKDMSRILNRMQKGAVAMKIPTWPILAMRVRLRSRPQNKVPKYFS
jgi:hypothetical protein